MTDNQTAKFLENSSDSQQNMTAGQLFALKSHKRQAKLFLKTPIIKAVIIISIPSMIIALMSSLYAFSDQIMMANLIPLYKPFETAFGADKYDQYISLVQLLNNNGLDITEYSSNLIVRNAVANSAPVTVIITAITLLVANGTSVAFNKANGKLNTAEAQKAWCIGFYSNIGLSVIAMVILFASCSWLVSLENGNPLAALEKSKAQIMSTLSSLGQDPNAGYNLIHDAYNQANQLVQNYSSSYSYLMITGLIFSMFNQFLSLLIISEGKQKMVVIAAIVCNVLNLILDFVFIYYAQWAMIGGACATLIGWIVNCGWYFIQILIMNKRNETSLQFSMLNLRKNKWNWPEARNIYANGLASFLRNLSMAIATWFQLFVLANIIFPNVGSAGETVSMYSNFYGAVNPIYNLFFPVLSGVINGSRIMCSYLYGAESWKRFRQTYWIAMLIGFVYGIIILTLVGIILNKYILMLFSITPQTPNANIARMLLFISLVQIPIYSFTVGGQLMFQATSRSVNACICALTQGIICNIPVTGIMIGICIWIKSIILFLWTPLFVLMCSSTAILIWTVIYMKNHFSNDICSTKIRYMQTHGFFKPKNKTK